jgi:hypothetical protein
VELSPIEAGVVVVTMGTSLLREDCEGKEVGSKKDLMLWGDFAMTAEEEEI